MKGHLKRGRVEGTWYLRVELARGANGARRQRREVVRGTKAEAERRLRDLLQEVETGGYADGSRMTVGQLGSKWLEAARHRVGAKTFQRYESIVKLYITPALGSLRAEGMRPANVEAALAGWISGGRNDRERGQLAPRTVKHIVDTLRTICRWGVRMSILRRNPVDAVEPPKVERGEMRALDPSGVGELLSAARGSDLEQPIAVAVGTGLRRGELLGLRWGDVDLDAARLTVRRSVETVDGVTRTKPPKTARSARSIALPPFVVDVLRRRHAEQLERRLLLGLGRNDGDGWVFTRADETPWEPGAFSLAFARLVKRAKLRHIRFHDLRHSFGTLAIESGVDLKTVSAALGHSTIAMTANTYVHAIEALHRDAATRIDTLLGRAVSDAIRLPAEIGADSVPKGAVPQRCHKRSVTKKKARGYGLSVVAPTGVEPVSPP